MLLPFRTKRELVFEWLNNLRVHKPAELEAALRLAMGARFDAFVAWIIQQAKDHYTAQRDDAQSAHDAIDALPEEEPEEPGP